MPWVAHDLPWKTVSVCVWRQSPFGHRVHVALSNEGELEILGARANPQFRKRIVGAGLSKPWLAGKEPMKRVREIGSRLYACGSGHMVFRRGQAWEDLPIRPLEAPAADLSRKLGISDATLSTWRSKYGGMEADARRIARSGRPRLSNDRGIA